MKTAIITGANGFIGSHIAYRLLNQGWRVHALGRSAGGTQWNDRVNAALREVGEVGDFRGTLFCHALDISAPNLTLDSIFQSDHSTADTILFHLAGDTRFVPPNPELQRQINVQATLNVVTALKEGIARVVHVSTAYVAGDRAGLIRECELDCGQGFHNSYEKSKCDAELAVTALCRGHELPLVIVRPSIITNDRRSGRASTFTHLNTLVEVVSRIQDHYGISDGQVVSSTLRLMANPEARPNLAPVDSIVPPLLRIAESPKSAGMTFHLCHPKPQRNLEVIDLICECFQVKGKLAIEFVPNIARPMSHTEEMILRSLKVYAPYLNNRCEFDLTNSRSIVPEYDSYFTPLDLAYIQKVAEVERHKRK
ncbi:MAG TPA: SDR family oxidoreductase [Verrucomicrobiae bacterium]|nr:SDR family oxidoreductase [Verrucomicrobiae bacterium]